MKTINSYVASCVTSAMVLGAGAGIANAADWGPYQVGDVRSGYTYMEDETREMQNDDFQNPAMLWVQEGEELWTKVEGEAKKSCGTCHEDPVAAMNGVAAKYPVYDVLLEKPKTVEQQINICREQNMQAKPYKWESQEMLAMTAYVNHQSRGMPVNVKVDGKLAPFFAKGEAFYNERRGQLDLACKNCHNDYAGGQIRANIMSQGQINGFPTYRLKWQKVGSVHRRFRGCNSMVRATPYAYGSDEYVNLELYVKWRGNGLPVESPAVRN